MDSNPTMPPKPDHWCLGPAADAEKTLLNVEYALRVCDSYTLWNHIGYMEIFPELRTASVWLRWLVSEDTLANRLSALWYVKGLMDGLGMRIKHVETPK